MTAQHIETDYLIVGAGAMGMAFADVLLEESPSARMVIVDRRARPGGHWNDAYSYVALHQPAAFYGVNSAELGHGGGDLASGAEIMAYYERVMARFVASGRVTFLPMSDYRDDGRIVSTVDAEWSMGVRVTRKVIDASYMQVEVPSVREPKYRVAAGARLVPPNALPDIREPWAHYVVVGGGKTGIDAVLFLLDNGVDARRIQWIVPHDAWLYARDAIQPGAAMQAFLDQSACITESANVDDTFLELEDRGVMCRIDRDRRPDKWRCATVSQAELMRLRSVENVVRKGRVRHIGAREIVLDEGTLPTGKSTLHIDCTADGLARIEPRPIFEDDRVTLQSVFMCQQVFSAAVIGHLEVLELSDAKRNAVCQPVPHPEYKQDFLTSLTASFQNMVTINRQMPMWLRRSRLFVMSSEPLYRYVLGALRIQLQLPLALTSANAMLEQPAA